MKTAVVLGSLVVLALGTACGGVGSSAAEAPGKVAAASAAMDSAYERFARAYRLGDPDSVLALYAEDPLYLPGQGDIRRGRQEVRSQFGFLERIREGGGTAQIGFESVARHASGDLAFDVGYYTLQVERADGSAGPPSRGKFTTVWERGADGAWRIRIDSFSPAAPTDG